MYIQRNVKIIDLVRSLYSSNRLNIPPKKSIIFICGSTDEKDARKRLKKYFDKHHKNTFDFIFAEDLNKLNPIENSDDDLLTQENYLADYSDCIMIVLESPSSFVELGAFVNYRDNLLTSKLMIINKNEYAKAPSFVNLGPVKRVQAKSKFKEIHYYKESSTVLEIAEHIITSLSENLPKYGKTKSFIQNASTNVLSFEKFEKRDILVVCHDLVSLLSPLTKKELLTIFLYLFGVQEKETKEILGVLLVLGYVKNIEGYLVIRKLQNYQYLLSSYGKERAKILKKYMKADPDRMRWYYDFCK